MGLTIKDIEILHKKSFIGDKNLVIGVKIKDIRRFAKILVFDLSNGLSIAIHLKLSGQLVYRGKNIDKKLKITDPLLATLPNKHTRVIIDFTNGDHLYFNDLRIFGWLRVARNETMKPASPVGRQLDNETMKLPLVTDLTGKLGPEPMKDLTLKTFQEILKSSKKPIKIVLMDQEMLSGVGNIYANDVLFLAKINPQKPANTIPEKKVDILFLKLLKLLKDAIRWGGASEDNFRDAYGEMGEVQKHFYVYQRDGEKCPNNCGGRIVRIVLGGRGTFFCPKCQRLS